MEEHRVIERAASLLEDATLKLYRGETVNMACHCSTSLAIISPAMTIVEASSMKKVIHVALVTSNLGSTIPGM